MSSEKEEKNVGIPPVVIKDVKDPEYTVYTRRYFILAIFVLYSASNAFQWIQYSIIASIVTKYYDISNTYVDWTSMIYMITYIPLIFPGSYILDKKVSLFIFAKRVCVSGRASPENGTVNPIVLKSVIA